MKIKGRWRANSINKNTLLNGWLLYWNRNAWQIDLRIENKINIGEPLSSIFFMKLIVNISGYFIIKNITIFEFNIEQKQIIENIQLQLHPMQSSEVLISYNESLLIWLLQTSIHLHNDCLALVEPLLVFDHFGAPFYL